MDTTEKLNINLINILNEHIKYPFIVFEESGKIISANSEAKKTLRLKEGANIYDSIDDETSHTISRLIEEYNFKRVPAVKLLNISPAPDISFAAAISVIVYGTAPDLSILCSIKPEEQKLSFDNVTAIDFTTNEISKFIDDDNILEIVDKVRVLYPFTFIGKEKLRTDINKLDDFFWIKDSLSKYLVVNNSLAAGFGVKPSQLEGKSENEFLPAYLLAMFVSIEEYIKNTQNSVIIEGVFLKGLPASGNYRLVQIPLIDSENNVIAVAGFTQKIVRKNGFSGILNSFIREFPGALLLLDNNGFIRNTSEEFCKLIQGEFSDFINKKYPEILPSGISEKVKYFLNSPIDKEEFDVKSGRFKEKYPDGFHIYLTKIIDKENKPAGISLLIEKTESLADLAKIINDRGPMFELLIKNNPEPIFIYDTDNLRFLEVNDAALSMYGYRRDEFLQMDLTDLYTPEDIQTLLDTSNSKTRDRQFSGPYRHKKKDGSSVFVEISKMNFKYHESDAHFNLIRDITERLELEKNTQLFKAAFDNTQDMVFITDSEGFITYINSPVVNILGYSKTQADKLAFPSLVKNEERAIINTSIFQSHLKESVSLSTELKKASGEFIEVELAAAPVLDYKSEVDSFIIIGKYSREVSSADKAPEIKEVIKEEIVEKPGVSEPAEGVESSAFISSLFHEILTPINVILGFVQDLTDSIEHITPEQKESVEIISQNRDKLLSTMNSIAEYSSIQKKAAEVKSEDIAITDIIDELQNEFNDISEKRGIDFAYGRISSSLKFRSDKEKFKEFASLLLNIAASVSREKKIYFSSYLIDDSHFALSVKDNYTAASRYLIDNFNILFNTPESQIVKDFGVPKLSLRLAKGLLQLLKGRFEIIGETSEKPDYAFIFPMEIQSFSEAQTGSKEDLTAPPNEEYADFKSKNAPSQIAEPPIPEAVQQATLHSFIEDDEITDQSEDIIEEEEDEGVPAKKSREHINRFVDRLDLSQLSCLYIEDQVDSQILFKVQMKELKSIKFAVSFEEALPLLDNGHFDFIVMDINLQGEYNGLDALKIIHKMPEYENIPIIAVTAYVLPGDKEKFIATGFNDFISKPIFREKMIESLEKIFLMQM